MKHLLIAGFFFACAITAFSQNGRVNHDPSYSASNYKHPNKAAYARKHNLDNSTAMLTVSGNYRDNYKQPYNKAVVTSRAAVTATKMDRKKRNASYKHPFGL
jgi:hypothetical protein